MLTMQTAVLLRPQLASGQLNTRKLPIDIQFCVKMQRMPYHNGVDWMKRRTKTKFTQIHVSIPVRLLEDFDATLSYTASRSQKIASLIEKYLNQDAFRPIQDPTRLLMLELTARDDVDDTMKALLLQILAK